MKYASFLPLTALLALSLISILVSFNIIPPGMELIESLQEQIPNAFFLVIFLIILFESIIYVGFYFPGQFFAVILVIGAKPTAMDVVYLTICMVLAATVGSFVNFHLGKAAGKRAAHNGKKVEQKQTKFKHLLLAMIHINSLAFFMFAQGNQHKSSKVIALAGVLNLPYYLLLIGGTTILSEEVMAMAENTVLLVSIICVWLLIAIAMDVKRHKQGQKA
jgi:membrane-associated protein